MGGRFSWLEKLKWPSSLAESGPTRLFWNSGRENKTGAVHLESTKKRKIKPEVAVASHTLPALWPICGTFVALPSPWAEKINSKCTAPQGLFQPYLSAQMTRHSHLCVLLASGLSYLKELDWKWNTVTASILLLKSGVLLAKVKGQAARDTHSGTNQDSV